MFIGYELPEAKLPKFAVGSSGVIVATPRAGHGLGKVPLVVILLVAVHVAVSFMLLVLVLLHSGKGGGLSDMFGGGGGGLAAGSTVVEKNLDRITVAAAIAWVFTTMILGIRLQ